MPRSNRLTRATVRATVIAATAMVLGGIVAACSSSPPGTGAAAAGTNGSSRFPVTIEAANGAVRVPARPTSIVSLTSTATEILYAIGAGSQVRAVDQYSDYPPQAPRTNLDAENPNVEAIASYHPDLVVIGPGDSSSLNHQLSALGIPVLYQPAPSGLVGAYAQFEQLGDATGHSAQAVTEVTGIKSRIASIVRDTPKPASPATYYYELDQTYYSVTSSTFIGQVLGLLGLKNIADAAKGAASSGGYPQLSAEFIIKADPEYMFLADTICCAQSPSTVATRPGWSTLRAVRDGNVIGLDDDIASRWGPRVVDLLQTVASALDKHPAAS
ncbi:MAG TPA: ABC transporter substrate-binding protein [Acidimicrobiales bacterium]|nr:ABC transporter substrate-binding protein [Acidimicrobiales bacterium]